MTTEMKELTIDQLGKAYNRAVNLEAALLIQREFDKADDADARADQLAAENRRVLAKRMAAWGVQAARAHTSIKASNTQLQRQITNVKNRQQTAASAVKALGYLDDIIAIAAAI
jgi:hypothetical protein